MKLFQRKEVVITSIVFIFAIFLLAALTITTNNLLDLGYAIFISLGFIQYLRIQKED